MQNKDNNGKLDDEKFYNFLNKIIAFIWAYSITNPGANALRSPIYTEMVKIVNDLEVDFDKNKIDEDNLKTLLNTYSFTNIRPITKSMLVWWMFNNDNQKLYSLDTTLEIEHIFAKNRQEIEKSLEDVENLEKLGNKAILEKRINIRAADYRFSDKIKYYLGFTTDKGKVKEPTKNEELLSIAKTKTNFTEQDIVDRTKAIITTFINYVKENNLLK